MKRIILTALILISLLASWSFASDKHPYGVFIGMGKNKILRLKNYSTLVVDAQYLSKNDIKKLRANGNKKIYSYLSVGSIENFRPYYKKFKSITLGKYEDWPEERWIDVSKKGWQRFIARKGKGIKNKGLDGFFIDNADVYHHYKKPKIYKGLTKILKALKSQKMDIVINGGDEYVLRAITKNPRLKYIDAINQETVFSKIDFENRKLLSQDAETKRYYQEYCRKAKKAGLSVYLLEYTINQDLIAQISDFCRSKNYKYYVSPSIELDLSCQDICYILKNILLLPDQDF